MKKTTIINIGNSIIHLEEDAYEALTVYLNEVKAHFANSADDFEIVTDIENRVAELLLGMMRADNKQVASLDDVRRVMAQMGSVNDFEEGAEAVADEPLRDRPIEPEPAYRERRLYRDMDNRVLAGVCSGLAHYLNIDVSLVRVAFVLLIFLGGSGLLAYMVLWIITPRADTRPEKMAMRGEQLNLRNFKKNFDEEMAALNENLGPAGRRAGSFLREFFDTIGGFLRGSGRILLKVAAICIVAFGFVMLLVFFVGLVAFLGFWDTDVSNYFPMSAVDGNLQVPIAVTAFVVLFVPVLALVLFSIRVAFTDRPVSKVTSFSLLIVWLAGIGAGVYLTARVSSEFREMAEFNRQQVVKTFPAYRLELDDTELFTRVDSLSYGLDRYPSDRRVVLNTDGRPFEAPDNMRLEIVKSEAGRVMISENYSANGKTYKQALLNAQNIRYKFVQQDSVLNFSPKLQVSKNERWRNQEVRLLLQVPVGTKLRINRNVNQYIGNYYIWSCLNDEENTRRDYSNWLMTEEGLKCLDLPENEPKE
ncbi:PspC family transcriptional regulator [Pedobacter yulinensis]|uniref:PspC family transcriptional regulator n=1 Tax=Pedobacter yulinensis TaxID=2126353 RepID=A0A2T3HNZ1_9SPHI|nr:PspC domain-containing protein [Pedobacter yulinensis]PST84164.1 PspC family transcriptional regulator [Pedobacter yulinensis]